MYMFNQSYPAKLLRAAYPSYVSIWAVLAFALAIVAPDALAQSHEVEGDGYVLRSSTVASDRIHPATAAKHGIDPSPDRAVLHVVLLSAGNGARKTFSAEVTVSMKNLAGVRRDVEMREVRENGRVSYIGSYEFLPREVLDFSISARPVVGGQAWSPLKLADRERMWSR